MTPGEPAGPVFTDAPAFQLRLGRVNERAATPAGKPFPARLHVIGDSVVPTSVGQSLRPEPGFPGFRSRVLEAAATFLLRIPACFSVSHNRLQLPSLASRRFLLTEGQARKRRAWNPALPLPSLRLGVIERAATPAREPLPTWVDVVPGAVIEACVKQLSRTTARFSGISAFFGTAAALIVGLLTCFFVGHNLLTFLSVVVFDSPSHHSMQQQIFIEFVALQEPFSPCLAIPV